MTFESKGTEPNIVFVMMDNLGYGELGVYGGGILRGAPTPRIDALAAEGMRLLNYNVESQCTPTRAALMTGRYPIRSGNAEVPSAWVYGLAPSEHTLARSFSDMGYATAIFGKWHLGRTEGRYPTDHGFDEWYGIANSSDESLWPDDELLKVDGHPAVAYEHILEAKKASRPKEVKIFNLESRALVDREITDRTIEFIQRQARAKKPFFAYVPYTQTHWPVLPHPAFRGRTGNGRWADVLMQVDSYAGELLDVITECGIRDDTLFIFTSDNGPEMIPQWAGSSGPWRGAYFTALEGSLRVPFIARWPGRIPPNSVSNEIVHVMDMFPTLLSAAGGMPPADRVMDGVDQLDFLTGKKDTSNRDGFVIYCRKTIFGVKWKNWKWMFKEVANGRDSIQTFNWPRVFNLLVDPREERHEVYCGDHTWVRAPVTRILEEHIASLQSDPHMSATDDDIE